MSDKKYFYGNEVSDYGVEHGRVDYRCLAKAFDGILNNDIMSKTSEIGYWEQVNGESFYHELDGVIYYGSDYDEKLDELNERLEGLNSELDDIQEKIDEAETDEEYDMWSEKYHKCEDKIESLESDISELEDEHWEDVFQWYIIDDNGASILKRETHEIVYYNEELDMYIWGVTHFGTSWDYVLTEIAI